MRFMSRTFFGWVAVSLALPALLDGWLSVRSPGGFGTGLWHGLLWGGLVRKCTERDISLVGRLHDLASIINTMSTGYGLMSEVDCSCIRGPVLKLA
jgi:hypothetical protein